MFEKEQSRREHIKDLALGTLVLLFCPTSCKESKESEKSISIETETENLLENIAVRFYDTQVSTDQSYVTTKLEVIAKGIENQESQPMRLSFILCEKRKCAWPPVFRKYDFSKQTRYKDEITIKPNSRTFIRDEPVVYLKAQYNKGIDLLIIAKKRIKD